MITWYAYGNISPGVTCQLSLSFFFPDCLAHLCSSLWLNIFRLVSFKSQHFPFQIKNVPECSVSTRVSPWVIYQGSFLDYGLIFSQQILLKHTSVSCMWEKS